jgi:hypothetical protein
MRQIFTLFAVALLSGSHGAAASVLYSGGGALYQIDQTTGTPTSTGFSTSPTFALDLATDFRPGHVSMWGISRYPTATNQTALIQIDPVGKSVVAITPMPAVTAGTRDNVLAIHPATGRTLVGAAGQTSTQLFEADRTTGATTLIGSVPLSLQSLQFDQQGVLYGTTEGSGLQCGVHVIDPTTAAATLLHTLPLYRILGLAMRPEDNQMFALNYGPGSYRLHKLDLATGVLTDVGPSLVRPTNLTFYIGEPASAFLLPIPAAAALALRRSRGTSRRASG